MKKQQEISKHRWELLSVLESLGVVSEFCWRTLLVVLGVNLMGATGTLDKIGTFSTGIVILTGFYWMLYPPLMKLVEYLRLQRIRASVEQAK